LKIDIEQVTLYPKTHATFLLTLLIVRAWCAATPPASFVCRAQGSFGGLCFMRTCVYVDGFNLYYGALKRTPYKWLDLAALMAALPGKIPDTKLSKPASW
tara:strand:- start:564 stop:863 length:300 start_codon:yes stop_codon:yes gene_type:complete